MQKKISVVVLCLFMSLYSIVAVQAQEITTLSDAIRLKSYGKTLFDSSLYDSSLYYLKKSIRFLENAQHYTDLEEAYMLIFYNYEALEDYPEALKWARKAQKISDKQPGEIHNNLCSIGYLHQMMGALDSAELYFKECVAYRKKYALHKRVLDAFGNLEYVYRISKKYEDEFDILEQKEKYIMKYMTGAELANVKRAKGDFLHFMSDSSATNEYFQALQLSIQNNNYDDHARVLMGLGDLYLDNRQTDQALEYYRQAAQICIKNNLLRNAAYAEIALCDAYTKRREYEKAMTHIQRAIATNHESGYEQQMAYLKLVESRLLMDMKRFDEALQTTEAGLNVARKHKNKQRETDLIYVQMKVLTHLGRYSDVYQILKARQPIADSLDNTTHRLEFAKASAMYYESVNDIANANIYLKHIIALEEILNAHEMTIKAEKLSAVYKINQHKKENEILKEQQMNQQQLIRYQQYSMVFVLVIMILLVTLAVIFYRGREKHKAALTLLEEKTRKIEALNNSKDILFSVISHDLRGPIGSISAFLNILAKSLEQGNSDQLVESIHVLEKQSKTAFDVLTNLLNWANSERGAITVSQKMHDLGDVTERVVDFLGGKIREKDIKIENNIAPMTIAYFDKEMIETVLRNLLSNALKFTPNGGAIRIECTINEGNAEIRVVDNGIGIENDRIDTILREDSYESTHGTRNEKGSGIGLKICKDFVQRNNGELTIDSAPGRGTTVQFTVPTA